MLTRQPFVRLLLPLVGGIIIFSLWNDSEWMSQFREMHSLFLLLCLLCGLVILLIVDSGNRSSLHSSLIYLCIFFLGGLSTQLSNISFQNDIRAITHQTYDAYTLEIKSLGQKKRKTVQCQGASYKGGLGFPISQSACVRTCGGCQGGFARVSANCEKSPP
jgi:hypothetical protein